MKLKAFAFCAIVLAALCPAPQPKIRARVPNDHANGNATKSSPQMIYHKGPLMTQGVQLYVIYYGSFPATTMDILDTFFENVGTSGAYGVNTTYSDGNGNFISNVAPFAPFYSRGSDKYIDAYSMGKSMKGNAIAAEIQNVLAANKLPPSDNAIYILITSPDVAVSKSFCGYHTASNSIISGFNIKYAFSPDPAAPTYNGCSGNITTFKDSTSPNGDVGADSVADTLMHEISETVTDPDLNAWFTQNGLENGDLCNFNYGQTFTANNGSHANHTFGTRQYLVQTIWQNAAPVGCSLTYPPPQP